jgi:hypothetical protein
LQAGVVAAPLHVSGCELFRQHSLKKGNVFLHQLLLKIFCAGGDDYSLAARDGGSNGRHKVGERLTRARARFHNQMALLMKSAQHGFGHLNLAGPVLVLRMSARN